MNRSLLSRFIRGLARVVFSAVVGVLALGLTVWGALALYYSDLTAATLRLLPGSAFALGSAAILLFVCPCSYAFFSSTCYNEQS